MAEIKTVDSGRRVFANLSSILFTPWTDEATLGDVTYDLVNIVGDTTSIEQEDNEVNAIEHEFSAEPLYENVALGSKSFTCECIDFQNDVLKQLFGWEVQEDGTAFAPIKYKDLYCKIELHFNSTKDIVVLPKVKLNSRAVIASMKSDVSRANIQGTCYSAYMKAGSVTADTDMAVIAEGSIETYEVQAEPFSA